MPVNNDTLNKNLYDTLRSKGYDPIALDSKGSPNNELEKADVFRFEYTDDDKKGNVWATIEANDLVLYIDDKFTHTKDFEPLTRYLKSWSQRRLLGFEITNKDHLISDMQKRTNMKKKEQLGEAYHPMGKKASYNDSVPTVKIILQHTRQIEEGEQRFRNIARIFVENTNGERFLLPTTRPGLARVYARHIAEGGTPYDDKGRHITVLVEEYSKMAGFVRATRNGQFNESALKLVNEGLRHYNDLRMTLQGIASHRGYNKYFESYTPVLNEESDDNVSLNELFVQETLDPRIESVMPILKRLNKNISEMNEVNELAEWAETITEVEDETTKTLAEPATKMLEGLQELKDSLHASVMRRIMNHHPKLLKDLDNLEWAIDDAVSFFVGDGVEEVGTSDISAIVRDVEQRMGERHADIDEGALGDGGHKVSDKPYVCVHAKKGKFKCHADTSYEAVKKAAQHWGLKSTAGIDAHLADITHTPVDEAPGAETLKHNQDTEKSNLKAFDLAEDDMEESAKDVMKNVRNKFRQSAIGRAREYGYRIEEGPADEPVEPDMDADDKRFDDAEPYEDMSDAELMKICHKMGMGKMCIRDGEGGLANRDEVINALYMQDHDESLEEDLDANQKRVGQLGPTEPVGKNEKNLRGKLVGASESVELDVIKTLSGIK